MEQKTDLVIGYGNTLRGDDAVGRLTAEAVERWGLTGVRTLSVHQLTPELAADIAAAHRAIFVDAGIAAPTDNCSVSFLSLQPSASDLAYNASGGMTHRVDPCGLLALACALYDASPTAYLLTIPGIDFDVRLDDVGVETLSATARLGMDRALAYLQLFLVQDTPT